MIQAPFVQDLARCLVPGGEFRFTTDHSEYFSAALEAVNSTKALTAKPDLWPWQDDPQTDFQKQFDAEGRETYRACWVKSF